MTWDGWKNGEDDDETEDVIVVVAYTPWMSWIEKKTSEGNTNNSWYCTNSVGNTLNENFGETVISSYG